MMQGMVKDAEASSKAQGDAQTLLASEGCNSPDLRKFLDNVKIFMIDPSTGISNSDATIEDLCIRAINRYDNGARSYCSCARPTLERQLTRAQVTYIRHDPKSNYGITLVLLPEVEMELRKCQH